MMTIATRPYSKIQLAKHYGVSRSTIERWMHDKVIPYVKIGGTIRFNLAEVERALAVFRVASKFDVPSAKSGGGA